MKKLFTLLCLFLLTTNAAWALTATFNLGVKNGISVPEGYFKSVGDKWSWNNKFNGGEYDGISFSQGLKMEADTKIGFNTEDVSVVTIVQSTYSDATIKFDNEELPVGTAEAGTGCRIYTLKNVPAGDHVIGRGSGESGLFYVKMKDVNVKTVTFINDDGWDNVYVWAWNDYENFTGGSWPGEKLTANGEGKYVWSTLGEPTKILFNDGGSNQTADLDFVDGGVYNSTGCINSLNSYTITFKTNLVWESVYAYAWSGDGDTAVKFLGDWPGTKVTDVDDSHDDYDIYTLTFEASKAPEKIIFSNGVGGKVGRTQTADLEFVDGKEYSLIYVPSDLMQYAIQLADSADEGEALNKLLEAIQYAYENDDESQLQAAIDQFIADTEKANYFIEFSAGKYYIIDAETGMMMAAGGSFGTHGIVNDLGLDLWLTPYTESRTVTIDSRVSGGGNSHFLSQNLFMDSEEWGWGLVYQGFGFYIKDPNSGKYINIDEDNNLVLSDTPREWIIVSAEGVRAERMEELAYATIDNPVDATFLITAPNFNRNDQRNAEAWNVSGNCTLSTGNEVNNCAESLHSTFTISQTLAGAPKGTYQLTAQGFYRQDDGASEAAPQFFIGSEMVQLPKLTGSEANASDASASFTNGLYTIDPITFYYDGTGDLTIGIQGTAEHQWVVFDNFCLTYLSSEKYEVYTEFVEETGTLTYYYDDQMASRTGVIEVYDPFFYDNGDNRFLVYSEKVFRAVIDPSMKNAPLTSMKAMFYGRGGNYLKPSRYLSNMTAIEGLENLNTSNVTDMSFMFNGCKSLTSLDLSSFNTAKVTDMSGMFSDCSSLTSLDLNPLNTSNVTDMSFMFNGCSALTSLDLSPLNTSNVTDMRGMFFFCDDLPSLDLSSFNTDKVTSMRNMFSGCENLTTIICDDDWSKSSVLEDSKDMFDGCTALVGGKGTTYDEAFTDATYARPDGGTESPGYFTKIEPQVYTEFDEATGTLTYYYDYQMASRPGVTELYDPVNQPLHFNNYYNKIVKVVIDPSMEKAPLTSTKNMFYGGLCTSPVRFQSLSALTSIEGLEYLNTKDVTDMTGMFTMCQSLTSLDLSSFNTSNVTTMNAMFSNCSSLQQVDVSSFDVSNVTDFGYMFSGCSKLTTILCSSDWSTGNAKSGSMFADCTALVGGMGTTFDASHRDKTYARPDGGTARPGYFTAVLIEGDLNGDGKVDIADAVAVLEVMAKDGNDPEADLNGDGKVDIADFVAVLEIMAKQ